MRRQYTIRSVPVGIDRALRRRAKEESKSLNAVLLDALARGLGLNPKPVEHTDLDALIGSWEEDPSFDSAISDFDAAKCSLPRENNAIASALSQKPV